MFANGFCNGWYECEITLPARPRNVLMFASSSCKGPLLAPSNFLDTFPLYFFFYPFAPYAVVGDMRRDAYGIVLRHLLSMLVD